MGNFTRLLEKREKFRFAGKFFSRMSQSEQNNHKAINVVARIYFRKAFIVSNFKLIYVKKKPNIIVRKSSIFVEHQGILEVGHEIIKNIVSYAIMQKFSLNKTNCWRFATTFHTLHFLLSEMNFRHCIHLIFPQNCESISQNCKILIILKI